MKLFGLEINTTNLFSQKNKKEDNIINSFGQSGFNFIGNSLSSCGNYVISERTMYNIIKKNAIASAGVKRISARIGRYGFSLIDLDGNVVDVQKDATAMEVKKRCETLFSCPTFYHYVYDSIVNIFGSGKKYSTLDKMNGRGKATNDSKVYIIDSRIVSIISNADMEITSYSINGNGKHIQANPSQIVDYIVYKNFDNPLYGESIFNSVANDALIDLESSGRQLLFFSNSAVPNSIVTVDPTIIKTQEQIHALQKTREREYKGNRNSNKVIMSNAIKDVKTLELTNQEIQLIDQRLYSDKKIGVSIGIDLRLLGYMKDSGSAFSDISFTTGHANEQIDEYARFISDGMKMEYERFVGPIPYNIELKNEYYNDIETEKKMGIEEIKNGIITRNEYRTELTNLGPGEIDELDDYTVSNNTISLDSVGVASGR